MKVKKYEAVINSQKVKNSSLLSKFLNDKKSRIRCKFDQLADKSASNMSTFTRLILFDFLSEIYIRNSPIFILLNYEFKFVMFSFLYRKDRRLIDKV